MESQTKRVRVAATVLGCAVAACLLGRLVAQLNIIETGRAVARAGALVVLAPLPFALGMTLDACGTLALLRALGNPTTLRHVLPVRLASEALHLTVPAGFVASDTATAMLLEARADVPVRDGVVASIARRWLVMRAHAAYISVAVVVGFPALRALSLALLHTPGLPWLVLASTAIPLAASSAIGAGLLGGRTFARVHALLATIPVQRFRRWLDARRSEALATDVQGARLRTARAATWTATMAFFGCWFVEALESAFLLHIVGADVSLPTVIALEGGVTLVRSLAVFSPSGLGVVDLGYVAVLPALGADAASAGAFALLKRSKELVWVVIGYAILGALRSRPASDRVTSTGWVPLPEERALP